jgi:hypothetical protein
MPSRLVDYGCVVETVTSPNRWASAVLEMQLAEREPGELHTVKACASWLTASDAVKRSIPEGRTLKL